MPSIDQHAPGRFCWFELATTDQAEAKSFYQSLFGWDVQDTPIGPSETYSSFRLQGRDVAAVYTMRPEQRAAGLPPAWLAYIRVEDVDESTTVAAGAGAKISMSPFDVMDLGRMAIAQDPTGATFAMWEPRRNQGTGLVGERGTVVWADLITPDQQEAADFYRELFNWKMVEGKNMVDAKAGQYFHIVHGGEFIGGIPPAHGAGIPAHWVMYFAVPECQAAIAKAIELGGRVISGPMTIEGTRQFAALADPQGAVFAIVNTVK